MGKLVSGRKLSVMALFLTLLALAAFMAVSLFSSTAKAGHQPHQFDEFTGFWMAVDPSDGGFNKLSITDIDGETANVGLSETFVSTCDGGRATLSGVGEVNEDGDLVVPITIQCLMETANDPDGDPVGPFTVNFVVLGDNLLEFPFRSLRGPAPKVSSD